MHLGELFGPPRLRLRERSSPHLQLLQLAGDDALLMGELAACPALRVVHTARVEVEDPIPGAGPVASLEPSLQLLPEPLQIALALRGTPRGVTQRFLHRVDLGRGLGAQARPLAGELLQKVAAAGQQGFMQSQ